MRRSIVGAIGCVWLSMAGCLMEADDSVESTSAGIARAGNWTLPDNVRRIGNQQDVEYDAAGAWNDGRACSGGLLDGTRALRDFLTNHFDGISSIGGYSCRRNTGNLSQLSVHGTGRALDIMIRTDGGRADNDVGDPIANWLVTHAENVGVQFIIWDRTDWGGYRDPPKTSEYGGPIPHVDHIHMELTIDGAHMRTPWFTDRDDDGIRNSRDNCPNVANAGQADGDGDGIGDRCDNCSDVANGGQADTDHDGIGNRCDNCPRQRNAGQADRDGDGIGNSCDICPRDADRHQEDLDGDGHGDACDDDDDGDGVLDVEDNCPLVRNAGQRDVNDDGIGNACQDDDDGDGILDADDLCPRVADPTQADADGNGRGDACDDRDDDGVRDATDLCPDQPDSDQTDLDGDGIGDACDDSDDREVAGDDVEVPPEVPDVEPLDDSGPLDVVYTPDAGGGCATAVRPPRAVGLLLVAGCAALVAGRRRRRR